MNLHISREGQIHNGLSEKRSKVKSREGESPSLHSTGCESGEDLSAKSPESCHAAPATVIPIALQSLTSIFDEFFYITGSLPIAATSTNLINLSIVP